MCYNEFAQKLCFEIMIANQCKQKIGEENGFKNVLTCLNSGNVVFESDEKSKEKTSQQNIKGQTILFGSFYYVFYLVIYFMFDKWSQKEYN